MSSIILSNIICSESIYALEEKNTSPQLPRSLSLPFINMGTLSYYLGRGTPSDWTDLLKIHLPDLWFHGPVVLACWGGWFPGLPGMSTVNPLNSSHLACNHCHFSTLIPISSPVFAPILCFCLGAKYPSSLELCKFVSFHTEPQILFSFIVLRNFLLFHFLCRD